MDRRALQPAGRRADLRAGLGPRPRAGGLHPGVLRQHGRRRRPVGSGRQPPVDHLRPALRQRRAAARPVRVAALPAAGHRGRGPRAVAALAGTTCRRRGGPGTRPGDGHPRVRHRPAGRRGIPGGDGRGARHASAQRRGVLGAGPGQRQPSPVAGVLHRRILAGAPAPPPAGDPAASCGSRPPPGASRVPAWRCASAITCTARPGLEPPGRRSSPAPGGSAYGCYPARRWRHKDGGR